MVNYRTRVSTVAIAFAVLCLQSASPLMAAPSSAQKVFVSTSPDVTIEALIDGRGKTIVMLPSWARGAVDFDDMRGRLAAAGFRVITPNPRGIGGSKGPLDNWSAEEQAEDVAAVIRATSGGPVVLLGHAYGNRIARAVASRHPELVCDLILVASGGRISPARDILQAVVDGANPMLPRSDRLQAIAKAHFAPGHDPAPWIDGWYPDVGRAQQASVVRDVASQWWSAGNSPIFLIQPRQDVAAPAANAELLKQQNPERVELVYLDDSGHAAFPEQPERLQKLISSRMERDTHCGR